MKASALLFLILILLILVAVFIVFNILNKAKIIENIEGMTFSKEQYLDYKAFYPTFTNATNKYVYRITFENKFDEPLKLNFISSLKTGKIVIDKKNINEQINSKSIKTFDIVFEDIFDNSKISNLNLCEREETTFSKLECSKSKSCSVGACLEDCKCYTLDEKDRSKNVYCRYGAKLENEIIYNVKVKYPFSISFDTREEKFKLPLYAPFDVYVLISPIPFNNLLPLTISLGINGENLVIKNVRIKMLNYSITKETFFGIRTERIDTSQECYAELNVPVNGLIYFTNETGFECIFQPVKIIVEEKEKEFTVNTDEKTKEIINKYCEGKSLSECAKILKQKSIEICNFYSDLEICKEGKNLLREYRFLIEIEFEKSEKFKKDLSLGFC